MEVNDICHGKIKSIESYGLFIELENGVTGLLHISEVSKKYVSNLDKLYSINQPVICKIIKIDNKGRPSLSFKAISAKENYIAEGKANDPTNLLNKIEDLISK